MYWERNCRCGSQYGKKRLHGSRSEELGPWDHAGDLGRDGEIKKKNLRRGKVLTRPSPEGASQVPVLVLRQVQWWSVIKHQ